MKQSLVITLMCLSYWAVLAQEQQAIPDNTVICALPKPSKPKWTKGTDKELISLLRHNLCYPVDQCIKGRTYLRFEVDTLGRVSNPHIKRELSKTISEQLKCQILEHTFVPATSDGKKTKVLFTLPINL